jgi:hypothetical protein
MHVHEVPPHKVHAHEMHAYEMNRESFDSSLSIPRCTPAKEALARVSESGREWAPGSKSNISANHVGVANSCKPFADDICWLLRLRSTT